MHRGTLSRSLANKVQWAQLWYHISYSQLVLSVTDLGEGVRLPPNFWPNSDFFCKQNSLTETLYPDPSDIKPLYSLKDSQQVTMAVLLSSQLRIDNSGWSVNSSALFDVAGMR